MAVHQILVGASPGDAISQVALRYRVALLEHVKSEIFALHVDPDAEGQVASLDTYEHEPRSDDDLLVFHASIGEPRVFEFLMRRPERVVVMYHNVSPDGPYRAFAPEFADLLALGRAELEALRPRVVAAVADSAYNAHELMAMGYPDVRVMAPAIAVGDLRATPPSLSMQHHLRHSVEGPVVLFVGQLLPHKRVEQLLLACHILVTYLRPDANFIAAGPRRLAPYVSVLDRLVSTLGLNTAMLPGRVRTDELVAFYERADLFVTLSAHEGFCIPLLEAMSFDLPILACDRAAIPETLGGAGFLLPPDPSPTLVAEAMAELLEDAALRADLSARGRARLASFGPEHLERDFVDLVLEFAT
ncbi:MAG: glycosyltransferase [Acidimicrobiia bacterium]|nr:glycosyltransferase [Acidimicrobiia bacterium]